jgi:serine O-acetyltransferase
MFICKNNLCELLESSLEFVNGNSLDLKPLFYKAIDENEENFVVFESKLHIIRKIAEEDLQFFMDSDPAAHSLEEIKLAYPGYRAIEIYRISHVLYELGYKVHARFFSELGHSSTGIDIHPAANIDYPFFIDHGTGIVIGQTATIGKRVKLYQSVTLGAVSLSNADKWRNVVRHPQVGNNVTIYAGASLLGAIKIGDNVTIGSNVFLTEDVPSNTRVVIGKPELIIQSK